MRRFPATRHPPRCTIYNSQFRDVIDIAFLIGFHPNTISVLSGFGREVVYGYQSTYAPPQNSNPHKNIHFLRKSKDLWDLFVKYLLLFHRSGRSWKPPHDLNALFFFHFWLGQQEQIPQTYSLHVPIKHPCLRIYPGNYLIFELPAYFWQSKDLSRILTNIADDVGLWPIIAPQYDQWVKRGGDVVELMKKCGFLVLYENQTTWDRTRKIGERIDSLRSRR